MIILLLPLMLVVIRNRSAGPGGHMLQSAYVGLLGSLVAVTLLFFCIVLQWWRWYGPHSRNPIACPNKDLVNL
jgi:hypothetical protein